MAEFNPVRVWLVTQPMVFRNRKHLDRQENTENAAVCSGFVLITQRVFVIRVHHGPKKRTNRTEHCLDPSSFANNPLAPKIALVGYMLM